MLYLDELDRLNIIQDLELFDDEEKKIFEEIATLARLISLTPTCIIVIFGKRKELLLAAQGLTPGTSREDYIICRQMIQFAGGFTIVPDTTVHPDMRTHACVTGPPHVRFFAGAPIYGAGEQLLGAICLFDYRPNNVTDNQRKALQILATRVVRIFEFDKRLTHERNKVESKSEALQMIVSQTPHFILTLNTDLVITFVNKLLRFREEDILGNSLTDMMVGESKAKFIRACDRCIREEAVITGEYQVMMLDGKLRWYLFKICPLKDDHPTVESLLIIAQDQTTYRTQQELLLEQDNRYRDIVENTSDMIVTVNIDGSITFANRSWLETMGIPAGESVIGRNVFEFLHPDNLATSRILFDMMNSGHGMIQVGIDWITRTGDKVNTAATIDCGIVDGKVAYQRGIFRDITKQKRHEQELLKNQLILTEAQKISRTGNLEVNYVTGEVKWSDELYNILEMQGSQPDKFIAELYQLIHENDREKAAMFIEESQYRLKPSHLEFRVVTPKGNTKYIYCNGAPLIIHNQKVTVMLFTLQDITEIRQFEKKVFTAAVESEERERTRMAGELHDGVCQYLASAGLMLDALSEKLNNALKPADAKSIRQLLDFSRSSLREGLNLVRKVSHDLFPLEFYKSGLLQSVRSLVNNLNAASPMKFSLEIRGEYMDKDPSVSINLFRIIQEFTRNSLKYSEATDVQIKINSSPEMVKLKIADNGKGFDMDRVSDGGKGIGLMSMKKRIESIGGTFQYKSSPGNGVQLRLKVPLRE